MTREMTVVTREKQVESRGLTRIHTLTVTATATATAASMLMHMATPLTRSTQTHRIQSLMWNTSCAVRDWKLKVLLMGTPTVVCRATGTGTATVVRVIDDMCLVQHHTHRKRRVTKAFQAFHKLIPALAFTPLAVV